MNYIYSVCLGFTKYNFSNAEGALMKAIDLKSNLVKIQVKPLDTDDPERQVAFDYKTFKSLYEMKSIDLVLRALVA